MKQMNQPRMQYYVKTSQELPTRTGFFISNAGETELLFPCG